MLGTTQLGALTVSRFMIGGNPFSGFSHQTPVRDAEMRHYFSTQHIKETLREAERLGVRTVISRADHHIMRVLLEYWDEGGKLEWVAQTCPELGAIERGIQNAIVGGAKACYVHGGVMDNLFAANKLNEVPDEIARIHDAGMPAGVAGHNPRVIEWAAENLDVDFFMCSYYNPSSRDSNAEHVSGRVEWFLPADRQKMVGAIKGLPKPAIHYKVMAAGRNDPREALSFVARHLRPQDAVCVGVFPMDKPSMLEEDLSILSECLQQVAVAR